MKWSIACGGRPDFKKLYQLRLFQQNIREEFDESLSSVSLVESATGGTRLLFGPVAAFRYNRISRPLLQAFSARQLQNLRVKSRFPLSVLRWGPFLNQPTSNGLWFGFSLKIDYCQTATRSSPDNSQFWVKLLAWEILARPTSTHYA